MRLPRTRHRRLRIDKIFVGLRPEAPNYSADYREFQGIKMPTTRRVYAYDAQGQKVPEPVLVSIDIEDVSFS